MNTWMSHTFDVSGAAARSRQGARRRDAGAHRRVGPLQGRRRRRHSVPHDSRAAACRRTSRAGPGTTRRGSTASGRTTTSTTWIGCSRKFETARQHVPKPEVGTTAGRRDRHHRLRHQPLGDRGEPRPARARGRRARPATCGCARIRSPPSSTSSSIATQRIYVVEQNRDAQMLGLMRLDCTPERVAQAAQRPALQRPADRRALGDRRHPGAGRAEGAAAARRRRWLGGDR